MEPLAYKTTYNIYLSNYAPVVGSYTLSQLKSIQGNSTINIILTSVSNGGFGIYKINTKAKDISVTTIPSITGNNTVIPTVITLPYNITTTFETISVIASYRNGFNTTFLINLSTVSNNILDKDISFLNTQVVYSSGNYIPILNLESNENTIYPVAAL